MLDAQTRKLIDPPLNRHRRAPRRARRDRPTRDADRPRLRALTAASDRGGPAAAGAAAARRARGWPTGSMAPWRGRRGGPTMAAISTSRPTFCSTALVPLAFVLHGPATRTARRGRSCSRRSTSTARPSSAMRSWPRSGRWRRRRRGSNRSISRTGFGGDRDDRAFRPFLPVPRGVSAAGLDLRGLVLSVRQPCVSGARGRCSVRIELDVPAPPLGRGAGGATRIDLIVASRRRPADRGDRRASGSLLLAAVRVTADPAGAGPAPRAPRRARSRPRAAAPARTPLARHGRPRLAAADLMRAGSPPWSRRRRGRSAAGPFLPTMPRPPLYRAKVRAIDLVFVLLVGLLSPLGLLVALAIRADSPGPALFRQVRVGRLGPPVRLPEAAHHARRGPARPAPTRSRRRRSRGSGAGCGG